MRFTNFVGNVATGLDSPGCVIVAGIIAVPGSGMVALAADAVPVEAEVAAASRSQPLAASRAGANSGSNSRTAGSCSAGLWGSDPEVDGWT